MLRSSARLSPWLCLIMALALLSLPVSGQKPKPSPVAQANGSTLVERVGSTGVIQLEAESFKQLTPKQQTLAYWLSQASIAIDPIIYDQNSRFGLRQKRLLEGVVAHAAAGHPKIVAFTKLFWSNRGNHNDLTAQKVLPEFPFEELKTAATDVLRHGGFPAAYGLPAL